LHGLWRDLKALDERIEELDRDFEQIAPLDPAAIRLQQVRGIGPLPATALLATVGDASQFASGREMAAWFGLKPKPSSSGGKERLLGISKRGDAYLRSLLVHGAQAVIRTAQAKTESIEHMGNPHCHHTAPEYRRSGVSE
jgi:transposase